MPGNAALSATPFHDKTVSSSVFGGGTLSFFKDELFYCLCVIAN
jgi:hypothetical protein